MEWNGPTYQDRLHYFVVGALGLAAYLIGWPPGAWLSLGLVAAALLSARLSVGAWIMHVIRPAGVGADAPGRAGYFRLEQAVHVVLLGAGIALLAGGAGLGWLPVLTASGIAILTATTGFSVVLIPYAALRAALRGRRPEAPAAPDLPVCGANRRCLLYQGLDHEPYASCRWCSVSSVRSYCTLQACVVLAMLIAVSFLMVASLGPAVTKAAVGITLVAVVATGLAITHETQDLVRNLERLEDLHRHTEKRCAFLKRQALAESVEEAALAVVGFTSELLGARRVSLMLPEQDMLRIVASIGIAPEIARDVAVPIGERICGRVFASQGAMVLDEADKEVPYGTLGLRGKGCSVSYPVIAAPMTTLTRRVGVLNATDKPGGRFSDQNLADLGFIAEAAAISLAEQLDRSELQKVDFDTIQTLATAVEAKDKYTHGHSERVKDWAVRTGREMGLSESSLQSLSRGAELHDIGKLAIPDELLHAPRRLTEDEWALVRDHPSRGVRLIRHLTFLEPIHPVILYHHEKLDGSGYPTGLTGDRIPIEARIVAVADAFDAMTSERAYRPPRAPEEAMEELVRCSGTHFAPDCVKAFISQLKSHCELVAAGA